MLYVKNCSVKYGEVPALKNISISVEKKEVVSILGTNGSGKSTLLRTVAGLTAPNEGTISFKGMRIDKLSPDAIVRMGVSLVPEGRQVFDELSVRDNLILGAFTRWRKESKNEIKKEADLVNELFPVLRKKEGSPAGSLSGGEQQMLAIARSLMLRPKLMLLDEPSMGLAPILVKEMFNTVIRLNERGLTLLIVEQNARTGLEISNRSYIMSNGKIVKQGISKDLLEDDEIRQAYFGMLKRKSNQICRHSNVEEVS